MKKYLVITVAFLALAGCQSTTTQTAETATASSASSLINQAAGLSSLISSVNTALPVNTKQATDGVTSMLSLAQNSLPTAQGSELTSLLGGLDVSKLGAQAKTLSDVSSTFSSLGLSPDMISQFAPIILKALQSQGASSSLISGMSALFG